jgi:hypothetical protein
MHIAAIQQVSSEHTPRTDTRKEDVPLHRDVRTRRQACSACIVHRHDPTAPHRFFAYFATGAFFPCNQGPHSGDVDNAQ